MSNPDYFDERRLWLRFFCAAIIGTATDKGATPADFGPDSWCVDLADKALDAYKARWVNSTVNSGSPDGTDKGTKAE